MRRTWAGEISAPHFGHTASSEARTFSRLILRVFGMGFSLGQKYALYGSGHFVAGDLAVDAFDGCFFAASHTCSPNRKILHLRCKPEKEGV
jgi:hypothetical protein